MPCHKITYQLEAFVDGECSADEEQMIIDHLENCADCRQRADGLRSLNEKLASGLGEVKAPADLWQRIEAGLPAHLPESLDDRPVAEHAVAKPKSRFRQPVWQMAIAAAASTSPAAIRRRSAVGSPAA